MGDTMRFQPRWSNLTDIGKRYGISAIAVGLILTQAGLKKGKDASYKAILTGHAKKAISKDDRLFTLWDLDMVGEIVEEAVQRAAKNPMLDQLQARVSETLHEARTAREEGDDILAELIEAQAYEDIPAGLAKVIKERIEARG